MSAKLLLSWFGQRACDARGSVAVLLACAVAGCAAVDTPPGAPVAAEVACPYGHHAVRRVPVINGLVAVNRALQDRVDRHEVVLGGCTGSQTTMLVCARCGFQLDRSYDDAGVWVRESSGAGSFTPAISAELRAFRALDPSPIRYWQHVRRDGRASEGTTFLLNEDNRRARDFIETWFKTAGREPGRKTLGARMLMWTDGAWRVTASQSVSGSQTTTMVYVEHQLAPIQLPANSGFSE